MECRGTSGQAGEQEMWRRQVLWLVSLILDDKMLVLKVWDLLFTYINIMLHTLNKASHLS